MSFFELVIIGIIALIVLGPERLPKAARTVGLWIGKAKYSFNSIKNEIERELQVQELQEKIKQQEQALSHLDKDLLGDDVANLTQDINQIANDLEASPQAIKAEQSSKNTNSQAEKSDLSKAQKEPPQ
ncbi:Sec-independent protein translocase protein TatB [Aliikangiella sp. IMCC44653]